MFNPLKNETMVDPLFGSLTRRGKAWKGRLRTPLFPETEIDITIAAQDDNELAACQKHLEQVISHAGLIRSQIAHEAFKTYQMYQQAEGDVKPYEHISSQEDVWRLIKPEEWHFISAEKNFKSQVVIDFGWPNPHHLVACLRDTELYVLEVAG